VKSIQDAITKEQLVNDTKYEFQRAGYSLSDENIKSNAFDFIAKKDDSLDMSFKSRRIITKVSVDLDLFKKQTAIGLQLISKLISGFPLLVAHSAAGKSIDEATLYKRHDVSAISLKTLRMYLKGERGLISKKISKFAHRGGIFVNLSSERFKERRKSLQLEMTILAKKVGTSRHSLYKYEKGESFPKITNYDKLISILGNGLDDPIDILETDYNSISEQTLRDYEKPRSKLQKEVSIYLGDKDFNVLWFKSEPFDGLSSPNPDMDLSRKKDFNHPVITGVTSSKDNNDFDRLVLIDRISNFLKKKAIWFIEDDNDIVEKYPNPHKSNNLIVVNISDFERMPVKDFIKILNEKQLPKKLREKRKQG
jgi:predicted transcriptional regulator